MENLPDRGKNDEGSWTLLQKNDSALGPARPPAGAAAYQAVFTVELPIAIFCDVSLWS
jgi:hypothetical protein